MSEEAIKKPVVRRKPGRPPKQKIERSIHEIRGISMNPYSTENIMELVYSNPAMFKRIINLMADYNVSDVHMFFNETQCILAALDHTRQCTINATFECALLDHYYCGEALHIAIKMEYLDKIFNAIDTAEYKLTMISRREDSRSTFFINIKNCAYDKDQMYEIETIAPDEINPAAIVCHAPIAFTLEGKHFKAEIAHLKKLSNNVTFQKNGAQPLQFICDGTKKIGYYGTYNNAAKIKLQSTITQDDLFRITVPIALVKPFSANCSGEDVNFALDHDRFSMSISMDKYIEQYVARLTVAVNLITDQ